MVWMVTPLPVVTMPTMRSPGSGWQQPAKCTAMPGMRPRIGSAKVPPLDFWRWRPIGMIFSVGAAGVREPGETAAITSRAPASPPPAPLGDQTLGALGLVLLQDAVDRLVGIFVAAVLEFLGEERAAQFDILV